jgi:hypothetical protein
LLILACWVHDSIAEEDLPLALAGSIPTEFGKLIDLEKLWLYENQLTGKRPFANFPMFCTSGKQV